MKGSNMARLGSVGSVSSALGGAVGGGAAGPSFGSFARLSPGTPISKSSFRTVRSIGSIPTRIGSSKTGIRVGGIEGARVGSVSVKDTISSPKWNFLKNAPKLTLGTPRSASEASFRSVRPRVAETKPLRFVEKTARFNPFQKGRERFAYGQAARGQAKETPVRLDTLKAKYGKVEAIPKTEVKAKIVEFPNRILAEKRAQAMQRLQPLVDARVLTQADAQQRVDTALAPQTRTNYKTETKPKTLRLQERVERVKQEYKQRKLVKKETRNPQSREKRVPFSVDWSTFKFRYENAKAQVEQASAGNMVDFKKVAEKISSDPNNISEAAHILNNHKDGSLPEFKQSLAGLGQVDSSKAADKIYQSVLANRPVKLDQGDKVTTDEVEKVLDEEDSTIETNHPLGETILRRATMLIYKTSTIETQESEAVEEKSGLKTEAEGKVIAFPAQDSKNSATLQFVEKPLIEQSPLFQSSLLKPAA